MKKNLQTTFSTRQKMLEPDFEIYYYEDKSQDFHYANVNPHTHNYYEFYTTDKQGEFTLNNNLEVGKKKWTCQYLYSRKNH